MHSRRSLDEPTIALLGTLDTKLPEYLFVRRRLMEAGARVRIVDVSLRGAGASEADVLPGEVAARAGFQPESLGLLGREDAVRIMVDGARGIIGEWVERGEIQGLMGLGGANGTALATGVMRALPVGFPKVMVSVMASGRVDQYVGASDLVMISSIGDLSLNRISRRILSEAVGAVLGMARMSGADEAEAVPLLGMTAFGVTQPCVDRVKRGLERKGFEVMLFHASGSGGRALERLAESRSLTGVVDLTTSELTDCLVGGSFSAGPDRLEGAGKAGLPQLVVPGALDLINFWIRDFPADRFSGRILHRYNPDIVLVRANADESRALGRLMADKLNAARGPVRMMVPLRGFSLLDCETGPAVEPYQGSPQGRWYDPEASRAFLQGLREAGRRFEVLEVDAHINDPVFADAVVRNALDLFQSFSGKDPL